MSEARKGTHHAISPTFLCNILSRTLRKPVCLGTNDNLMTQADRSWKGTRKVPAAVRTSRARGPQRAPRRMDRTGRDRAQGRAVCRAGPWRAFLPYDHLHLELCVYPCRSTRWLPGSSAAASRQLHASWSVLHLLTTHETVSFWRLNRESFRSESQAVNW